MFETGRPDLMQEKSQELKGALDEMLRNEHNIPTLADPELTQEWRIAALTELLPYQQDNPRYFTLIAETDRQQEAAKDLDQALTTYARSKQREAVLSKVADAIEDGWFSPETHFPAVQITKPTDEQRQVLRAAEIVHRLSQGEEIQPADLYALRSTAGPTENGQPLSEAARRLRDTVSRAAGRHYQKAAEAGDTQGCEQVEDVLTFLGYNIKKGGVKAAEAPRPLAKETPRKQARITEVEEPIAAPRTKRPDPATSIFTKPASSIHISPIPENSQGRVTIRKVGTKLLAASLLIGSASEVASMAQAAAEAPAPQKTPVVQSQETNLITVTPSADSSPTVDATGAHTNTTPKHGTKDAEQTTVSTPEPTIQINSTQKTSKPEGTTVQVGAATAPDTHHSNMPRKPGKPAHPALPTIDVFPVDATAQPNTRSVPTTGVPTTSGVHTETSASKPEIITVAPPANANVPKSFVGNTKSAAQSAQDNLDFLKANGASSKQIFDAHTAVRNLQGNQAPQDSELATRVQAYVGTLDDKFMNNPALTPTQKAQYQNAVLQAQQIASFPETQVSAPRADTATTVIGSPKLSNLDKFVGLMVKNNAYRNILGSDGQTHTTDQIAAITKQLATAEAIAKGPDSQSIASTIDYFTPPKQPVHKPVPKIHAPVAPHTTPAPKHPTSKPTVNHSPKTPEAPVANANTIAKQRLVKFGIDPQYAAWYVQRANQYDLSPYLLAAQGNQESGNRQNPGTSSAGATGIAQFMPETWKSISAKLGFPADASSMNPYYAIWGQAAYMRELTDDIQHIVGKYNAVQLSLAAYNSGPGNVEKYGGIPPFAEPQQYVPNILAIMQRIQNINVTPPAHHPAPKTPKPQPKHEAQRPAPGEITRAPSNHVEYVLHAPSGGAGHDAYYINQSTDLGGFDGINGGNACGLASLYTIWTSLNNNPELPARDLHQGLMNAGAYSDSAGITKTANLLSYATNHLGLKEHTIRDEFTGFVTDSDLAQAMQALKNHKMILVHTPNMVSISRAGQAGNDTYGHFFVLYAADKAGRNFYVANVGAREDSPRGGKPVSADQIKGWLDGMYVFSN